MRPAAVAPLGESRDPPERDRGQPGQAEGLGNHAAASEGRGAGTPHGAGPRAPPFPPSNKRSSSNSPAWSRWPRGCASGVITSSRRW